MGREGLLARGPSRTLFAMQSNSLLSVCISANLGGLLVGLHLAVFSGILETPAFAQAFPSAKDPLTKSLISIFFPLGAILGAIPSGPLADKVGRRPCLMLVAATFATASLLQALSTSLTQILLTRLLAGVSYALGNLVCPMYTAETSPPESRGVYVNLYQLFITIGILAAQICNAILWQSKQWQTGILLSCIPAVVMLSLVWARVPESPVWLRGCHDEESDRSEKVGVRQVIQCPSARRRLLIGTGLCVAQQTSGIIAVIFFGPALVADALHLGGSGAPFQAAAVVGAGNVAATIASLVVVRRFGRRSLLLSAGAPMICSLVMLGLMRDDVIGRNGVIGIGALLVYICAFAVTYGPLPFVICAEVFPLRYKGLGMGLCNIMLMTCTLGIGATFLPLLERLGGGVYYAYGACVALSTIFIWAVVPETRGLTLAEIDHLLDEAR